VVLWSEAPYSLSSIQGKKGKRYPWSYESVTIFACTELWEKKKNEGIEKNKIKTK